MTSLLACEVSFIYRKFQIKSIPANKMLFDGSIPANKVLYAGIIWQITSSYSFICLNNLDFLFKLHSYAQICTYFSRKVLDSFPPCFSFDYKAAVHICVYLCILSSDKTNIQKKTKHNLKLEPITGVRAHRDSDRLTRNDRFWPHMFIIVRVCIDGDWLTRYDWFWLDRL